LGAVVTSRPEIKSLKDLEGKDLAAAKGTTNYVMFDWFARQLGVDTAKLSVVNTATPGLVGYALADRATAVQLWEPAYTTLHSKSRASGCLISKSGELEEDVGQHKYPVSRRRGSCRLG
jgi:ABC-type nitrate/sulfonate/bicarbonate transport system substrate-binding protein